MLLAGERLAAMLFAVGIHAVASRDLAMRAREAAIRVVLGGRVGQVVWALARGTLLWAGMGLAAGVLILPVAVPGKVEPVYVAAAVLILLMMAGAALATPVWRVRNLQPAAMLKRDSLSLNGRTGD